MELSQPTLEQTGLCVRGNLEREGQWFIGLLVTFVMAASTVAQILM